MFNNPFTFFSAEEAGGASLITSGLIMRIAANEGSGTTAADSIGSNDLTLNSVPWSTDVASVLSSSGLSTHSLDFAGAGINAQFASSVTLNPSSTFTYSFWWKSNNSTVSGHHLSGAASTASNRVYNATATNLRFWSSTATSFNLSTMFDSTWQNIVFVGDSGNLRCFQNGTESSSGTRATTDDIVVNYISSYGSGTSSGINGKVDDIRLYNRALSTSEVSQIAAGTG